VNTDLVQSRIRVVGRLAAIMCACVAVCGVVAPTASAALKSHGQRLSLAVPRHHLLRANTNQSNNWFGYDQGVLEQGGKLFHSITGDWTVPSATQHTAGQAEASSDWIGIGGGCIDAGCTLTDETLIQTGTEQDVASDGTASYSAWWEIIPVPSLTITSMKVGPGDHMHASISELVSFSDIWKITIQDVTRGESFSTTVPYPSTHATAEWIEETPLEIGTSAGLAALPNLSDPAFDLGTTNGHPANLKPSEQIQLIDSSGHVIGAPSSPDSDLDGFGDCAWSTSCSPPSS
jgi:hypothetical protein